MAITIEELEQRYQLPAIADLKCVWRFMQECQVACRILADLKQLDNSSVATRQLLVDCATPRSAMRLLVQGRQLRRGKKLVPSVVTVRSFEVEELMEWRREDERREILLLYCLRPFEHYEFPDLNQAALYEEYKFLACKVDDYLLHSRSYPMVSRWTTRSYHMLSSKRGWRA
jgi:hypothetical protein